MSKKNFINKFHLEGAVYQHNLKVKEYGPQSKNPGAKYIDGTIQIVTDNEGLNIVPVTFRFVNPVYAKSGKTNDTYNVLEHFIDGSYKTVMTDGAEAAHKVIVDGVVGLNEFIDDKNDGKLISAKRCEGSFIKVSNTIDADETKRNEFEVDMLITSVSRKEADDEKNIPEKAIIKGCVFDFRKAILPVEFTVLNPAAMDYFESLDASPKSPVFTKVKGNQISETIVRKIVEEGAFGEPSIKEVKSSRKDFVVFWAAKEPYEWDTEETITAKELSDAIAEREVYVATLRKNHEDYKASKGGAFVAAPTTNSGFDF